jgi:hypothetical protein
MAYFYGVDKTMNEKEGFFITTMTHVHCLYNVEPERKMKKG